MYFLLVPLEMLLLDVDLIYFQFWIQSKTIQGKLLSPIYWLNSLKELPNCNDLQKI